MDAMLAVKGSVWDPPQNVVEDCNQEVDEAIRYAQDPRWSGKTCTELLTLSECYDDPPESSFMSRLANLTSAGDT